MSDDEEKDNNLQLMQNMSSDDDEEDNINMQQNQKMVKCFNCNFSLPEATHDESEDEIYGRRLYRWKSIEINEFEYVCSECVDSVNEARVTWTSGDRTNTYLVVGQVVLAQVDEKEGEEFNDGWFRATVWKVDNKKKECEIEFHDKSKGIWTKNYDDIKTLETFYRDPTGDMNEVPLLHQYDDYADYAQRHNLLPEFDFVLVADDQISQELNQSLNQNLEDILVAKKALKTDTKNATISNTGNNFKENQQNSHQKVVERYEKKVILINPWEFCYVRGETVLKSGVIDEYYTEKIQYENYLKARSNASYIKPKSKRRKRQQEPWDNPVRFCPLNYPFFDDTMQFTIYQRIATNFFIDKNNQVIIEDYISGLTPRKNHTSLYRNIGKIFSYFVPLFEKCIQKIYEKYKIHYLENRHGLDFSMPKEKILKLIMEQSCLQGGRKMQIFVKAVDFKIQPGEKFQGEWQVEGLLQENIVAVGIYCCEISEDLSGFGVEFRRGVTDSDINEVFECYDLRPPLFDSFNAEIILGSIPIKKNRCIAFPNDVQHRITKFQQKIYFNKKNQESVQNCKILYFFLVDPGLEIVSSADIKNQNWEENKIQIVMELQKIAKRVLGQSFSQEVVQKILLGAKTGFNREEELAHRKAAMQPVKIFNDRLNDIANRDYYDEISIYN